MHFLSFSHLKVQSLWQGLGMTKAPSLQKGEGGLLEVQEVKELKLKRLAATQLLREVKVPSLSSCVPVILSKGSVAINALAPITTIRLHNNLFSVHQSLFYRCCYYRWILFLLFSGRL